MPLVLLPWTNHFEEVGKKVSVHMSSFGLTWSPLVSPGLAWSPLDLLGLAWFPLVSTGSQMVSLGLPWSRFDLKGKREPKIWGKRERQASGSESSSICL